MLGTLSKLFGWVVERRNRRFDDKSRPTVTVTVPVISVGNLTTGGTGKTPMVQLLVRLLQGMSHSPAVILRGYRRSTRGLFVVHDGTHLIGTAREAGDEARLHAQRLGVPVVVSENKVDAAVHAAGMLPCDVIVVDDGFQHRSLRRDVDVVLVNRATLDDQRLLPAGRLREPLTSLQRADVVILSGGSITREEVERYCKPDVVIARMQITADAPYLSDKKVLAFAGIANPERFKDTLRGCHAEGVGLMKFRDHHVYDEKDIARIIERAKSLGVDAITTEKDAVKLEPAKQMFTDAGVGLLVVPIEARITDGLQELEQLLTERIAQKENDEDSSDEGVG